MEKQYLQELNDYCSNLKDEELTEDVAERVVGHFSNKYMDVWYVVGIHPDRYDDNFDMYYSAARMRVRSSLSKVKDPRFQFVLQAGCDTGQEVNVVSCFHMKDEELGAMTEIIPVYAQREGNLVTITEIEQKRFERLVGKARAFAKNIVAKDVRKFLSSPDLNIYWWEKDGHSFWRRRNPERAKQIA